MDTPTATSSREWPAGWYVEVVAETGSTNADLLAAAVEGALDRTVLVALHQTAGRGRLDRRWDAPPGVNLLASLLFRDFAGSPHVLTQRVGLAALTACKRLSEVNAELKWPNDLLLEGAKLAGILAQAQFGERPAVVVGIGINVGWAPEGAAFLGAGIDPLDVLAGLLRAYDDLPTDVWPLYRQHLATLGKRVKVELADRVIEGRAVDVEPDGRLVVVDDGGITHHFDTGDVVHLR